MLALALGLSGRDCVGETLGLRWADVDLDDEYLKPRRNRLRPKYEHGCPEVSPCGREAGYCYWPVSGAGASGDQTPRHLLVAAPCRCRVLWW